MSVHGWNISVDGPLVLIESTEGEANHAVHAANVESFGHSGCGFIVGTPQSNVRIDPIDRDPHTTTNTKERDLYRAFLRCYREAWDFARRK